VYPASLTYNNTVLNCSLATALGVNPGRLIVNSTHSATRSESKNASERGVIPTQAIEVTIFDASPVDAQSAQSFASNEAGILDKWARSLSLPSEVITAYADVPSGLMAGGGPASAGTGAASAGGLSGGEVAGIVLGTLVAAALGLALLAVPVVVGIKVWRARASTKKELRLWMSQGLREEGISAPPARAEGRAWSGSRAGFS